MNGCVVESTRLDELRVRVGYLSAGEFEDGDRCRDGVHEDDIIGTSVLVASHQRKRQIELHCAMRRAKGART